LLLPSTGKLFFHIFVLAGLALSPLYGVLSKEPNFFLAHNSEPIDFIVLMGMISFVFPLVIAAGVTLLLFFFSSYEALTARIFVAFFAVLVLLPFAKRVMDESVYGTFIVAGVIGLVFSFVYGKFSWPKLFLNYVSPAILIFPVLFLFEPKIFVIAVPEFSEADYPVVSVPSDTPVIFLLFDEFPLATIVNENLLVDKKAFPNFDRLANKSHWFRNASTNYAFTGPAVRSIFTGTRQDHARFGTYKYYPKNLFSLLGHDYQVEAHESALRLCPPSICLKTQEIEEVTDSEIFWKDVGAIYLNLVLPQPRSYNAPNITQSFKGFWGRKGEKRTVSRVSSKFVRKELVIPFLAPDFEKRQIDGREDIVSNFLGKLGSGPRKKFYFLHVLFPHQPYSFLPSGKKYDLNGKFDAIGLDEKRPKGGTWNEEKWLVDIQIQKLLSQVGYTDYLLGQFLDRLEENNLLDPALLIVAADHGVSIREGGFRREVNAETLEDIASVPFFIKLPDQEKGTVNDMPATLLDILPTLADVLGIEVPWKIDGYSLLNYSLENRQRVIHDSELRPYQVPEDLKAYLQAGVKKKHDLFGLFKGWDKFRLQVGKSQVLMDKPVSKFTVHETDRVRVELDLGSRIEAKPDFLPAIVQGRITGIENREEWVSLIAVNGVFRAVSPVIKISDQENILAFLPEIAFKDGGNDVAVYLTRKPYVEGGEIFKPILN
jgi:hypothetical protein